MSFPFEYIFARGLRAHENYLAAVDADGLQITPVESPLVRGIVRYGAALENYDRSHAPLEARGPTGRLGYDLVNGLLDVPAPKRGYLSEAIGRIVDSAHQSFRDEVKDSGLAALSFPRWPESVQQMRYIQRAAGRDLLAVLYPAFRQGRLVDYTDSESRANEDPGLVYAPFLANTVQPKSEHFRVWGLTEHSDVGDIGTAMREHGLPYVSLDVLHIQSFEDPLALCERLAAAGLIRSVHLSVGRKDEAKRNPAIAQTTKQADRAFMKSLEAAELTPEGEMLKLIVGYWKRQPPHLRPKGGYSIVLEKPFRKGVRRARREDRATLETVKALIESA